MGEEGEFTFYIDVVDRTFALNSVTTEIIPFGDYPYNTTEMFQYIRTKFYEVHKDGIWSFLYRKRLLCQ